MAYRLTTVELELAHQPFHKEDSATLQALEDLKSTREDLRIYLIGHGGLFLMALANLWDGIHLSRLHRREEFTAQFKAAQ
ncbi:MAG TPA: hypothetical protein VGO67_22145 [Verrucomicrobiae bacterium]|jgi:hypothetical protein